jgi:hypothetical protein
MTVGAIPVGPINLSDNNPEAKEGYEGSGDDDRLKHSDSGTSNMLQPTIPPCSTV